MVGLRGLDSFWIAILYFQRDDSHDYIITQAGEAVTLLLTSWREMLVFLKEDSRNLADNISHRVHIILPTVSYSPANVQIQEVVT